MTTEEVLERHPITAEIANAIQALESSRGTLDPKDLVEAARDPDSALHPIIFEHDDQEASDLWRLDLARKLIRRVKLEIVTSEVTLRAHRYVHDVGADGSGYRTILKVSEPDATQTLVEEVARLRGNAQRTSGIVAAWIAAGRWEVPAPIVAKLKAVSRAIAQLEEMIRTTAA